VPRVFKNYLSVTLRNLHRNKGYSFINIFGLALSLGLGLLIIQMIVNFTSYDRFHANKERIYRVNTWRSGEDKADDYASTPFLLASVLLREAPGVQDVAQSASGIGGNAVCRGKVLPLRADFGNPGFFQVFSFKLKHGDPATALGEPNSIVLSQDVAEKFFGDENPVGEVLQLGKWGDYTITGVLEDTSRLKTHMPVQSMVSLSTLVSLEKQQLLPPRTEDWTDIYRSFTYVMLEPSGSPRAVEDAANLAAAGHLETSKFKYRFWLQPLTRIVPGRQLTNDFGENVPWGVVYVLAAVGLLVVLSAAFNYTNLSGSARSSGPKGGNSSPSSSERRSSSLSWPSRARLFCIASF
jgi:putative ABC transport system permease protein